MPLFTLRLLDVVETDHDIFARNHIDALQADLKGALRVTTLAIAPSPEVRICTPVAKMTNPDVLSLKNQWTGLRGNLTEEVLAGAIEPPEQAAPKPLSRRNSYMHHNSQVSLPGVSGNSIKMQQPQLEGSRIFVCGTKRFKSMVTEMLLTLGYMESVIVELA
ncbi:hypothetical protein M427DRAFT_469085 [Gonapodya prolifera JEL478]|uniref:Uncharacterized protein n=1 Tax=Gonapodya prolifera (strain JEL478) TaxID=1344416 RepID=A0A139AQT2_GONPJ|nr:hypothetical protein M427DRAFT_469085 [Gonapodya prolifera JEL478]|eukprot:KXS19110.1 hypothetical protein M427DRAFT_469085 [Gonapodya prolifera JEL478]